MVDRGLATRRARLSRRPRAGGRVPGPAEKGRSRRPPDPPVPKARPYRSRRGYGLQAELTLRGPVATLGVVPERGRGREGQRDGSRRERLAARDSRGRSVDVGRTAPRAGSANPKKSCQRPRAAERALLCASSGGLVPDGVARAHADPLGDGAVLLLLLAQDLLDLESLLGRLLMEAGWWGVGGKPGEDVLREGRDQTLDEIPSSRRNAGADARARIRQHQTESASARRCSPSSRSRRRQRAPSSVRRRADVAPGELERAEERRLGDGRAGPGVFEAEDAGVERDAEASVAAATPRGGSGVGDAPSFEKHLCRILRTRAEQESRRGTRPPGFVLACEGIARRRAARVRVFRRFVSVHPGTRRRSPREAASSHSRARRRGFPHPSRDSRPRPRAPLRASHRVDPRRPRVVPSASRVASRRVRTCPRSFAERGSEHPDDPGGGSDMSAFQPHGSGVGGGQVRISYTPPPDLTSSRASSSRKRDARPPGGSRRRDRRDEISLTRRRGRDRSRSPRTPTSERPALTSPLTLFSFPPPSFFLPPDES